MVRFVVMAAGQATRMGRDKLALACGQTTVLGHVLQTVLDGLELQKKLLREFAGFSEPTMEILVVARRPPEEYLSGKTLTRFRELGGIWLQVPCAIPLAETLRLGLSNLKEEIQTVGFLPGDQVGVTAQGLAGCFTQVLKQSPDFLVPVSGGLVGSPVFFHRRYVEELRDLQGEQGGKSVLYRYPGLWTKYTVEEGFLQDVDTPEEYRLWTEQSRERHPDQVSFTD
ncbi:NTP transferase domain-containing protein [Desulfosporosinus sp. PR]|uniref:nucleotidyltransferase family protein n=1 Tax=Candidatus Desulfosporosinus nitrosoreducens TaxID=3401928 RepID=UPI0027F188BE|nr:NTP transferase domain-containing protein [Desulfosporosinus sp. PR]MDQ7096979.1 NTP transferase domain-containing protein [Desulfosporosinus sp. PR]